MSVKNVLSLKKKMNYKKEVEKICKRERIKIYWIKESPHSFPSLMTIYIAWPKNLFLFRTCLHEVSHCLLNHPGNKPKYIQEREAEFLAMKMIKKLRIKIPQKLIDDSNEYALQQFNKHLRGDVREEIIEVKGIKYKSWSDRFTRLCQKTQRKIRRRLK